MKHNIFTIEDIITIVMEKVKEIEGFNLLGIQFNEEINLPMPINNKIESLTLDEYDDFINRIKIITEEIIEIKTGELNELNFCYEEIEYLSKDILLDYIKCEV